MYRILVGLALIGCSHHAPTASPPPATAVHEAAIAPAPVPEPVPLGPLPADVHPTQQSLRLEVDPKASSFTGATRSTVRKCCARRSASAHVPSAASSPSSSKSKFTRRP
jgi:hypothetical protein